MKLDAPRPRLPIGWPLFPLPDDAGRLQFPVLATSVQDNLRVILSTRAGEQLMHPGYGAGLVDFVGQPDTVTTRRRVHDRVKESVERWERRIELLRVDVTSSANDPGILKVHIAYRLRRNGALHSLGINLELNT